MRVISTHMTSRSLRARSMHITDFFRVCNLLSCACSSAIGLPVVRPLDLLCNA